MHVAMDWYLENFLLRRRHPHDQRWAPYAENCASVKRQQTDMMAPDGCYVRRNGFDVCPGGRHLALLLARARSIRILLGVPSSRLFQGRGDILWL